MKSPQRQSLLATVVEIALSDKNQVQYIPFLKINQPLCRTVARRAVAGAGTFIQGVSSALRPGFG